MLWQEGDNLFFIPFFGLTSVDLKLVLSNFQVFLHEFFQNFSQQWNTNSSYCSVETSCSWQCSWASAVKLIKFTEIMYMWCMIIDNLQNYSFGSLDLFKFKHTAWHFGNMCFFFIIYFLFFGWVFANCKSP